MKAGQSSEIDVTQVKKKRVAKKNIDNNIEPSSSEDELDAEDLEEVKFNWQKFDSLLNDLEPPPKRI